METHLGLAETPYEASRGEFRISTSQKALQVDVVHQYLTRSYWATGIERAKVQAMISGSLCFGLYHHGVQIGFARVVSDFATFGYLADVFVLEEYQGQGLGKWLIEVILAHPKLQDLRRLMLFTRDAHRLYADFGFTRMAGNEHAMEIFNGVPLESSAKELPPIEPYRPRRIECVGSHVWSAWHLKQYVMNGNASPSSRDVLSHAEAYAQAMLSVDKQNDYVKAGFITLHFGEEAVWLLIDLWYRDILHHFLHFAPIDEPHLFRPAPSDGTTACVWELEVTNHERNAWVKHVLSDPGHPDLDAYMADRLVVHP